MVLFTCGLLCGSPIFLVQLVEGQSKRRALVAIGLFQLQIVPPLISSDSWAHLPQHFGSPSFGAVCWISSDWWQIESVRLQLCVVLGAQVETPARPWPGTALGFAVVCQSRMTHPVAVCSILPVGATDWWYMHIEFHLPGKNTVWVHCPDLKNNMEGWGSRWAKLWPASMFGAVHTACQPPSTYTH